MKTSRLQSLLEQNGVKTREYSGRFMYGRQCLAATGEFGQLIKDIGDTMSDAVHTLTGLNSRENTQELSDIVRSAWDFRMDNMGTDVVIYWPNIEYSEKHFAEDTFGDDDA